MVFTNKDKIVVVSQQITNQIVVFAIHWLGRVTVPYLLTRTSKEYCRIVLVAFLWLWSHGPTLGYLQARNRIVVVALLCCGSSTGTNDFAALP